jgi:uncharacterized membrane protein (DUF373 family)
MGLLHTIAFTVVLVKAYKILIVYAQTQHVNLKYLVEIAIIAPTIELIFNSSSYSFEVLILLASFAFANLVAYLFFYKTLKLSRDDYEKEFCDLQESRRIHKEKEETPKKPKKTRKTKTKLKIEEK